MAESEMTGSSSRTDRRREATRRSLVVTARALLRRPDYATVPISEIARAADVGLGSFYNHFSSRGELFAAAIADVLSSTGVELARSTAQITDAPHAAAVALRAIVDLVETNHEAAVILAVNGLRVLDVDRAIDPLAREIVCRGQASGQFVDVDQELLLAMIAGSIVGALHTWHVSPHTLPASWQEDLVERLLVTLGLPLSEAGSLARL